MNDYLGLNYDDKNRWMSYWYQAKEVLSFNPRSVLIIGKGNGLIPEYLKLNSVKTVTLDINESLNPDVVASVTQMPFQDGEFDAAICAQVLEHLPYEDFGKSLSEIKRVVKNGAVVSLPHFGPAIRFLWKLPLFPEIKFLIKIPYPKKHIYKGEHYWEIGKIGYPLKKIKDSMKRSGFSLAGDFIVFENPLHHFFILKK